MELSCPGLFASLSIGKTDLCKIAGHGEKPLKTNSFDPQIFLFLDILSWLAINKQENNNKFHLMHNFPPVKNLEGTITLKENTWSIGFSGFVKNSIVAFAWNV